jgi:hypothetical protein
MQPATAELIIISVSNPTLQHRGLSVYFHDVQNIVEQWP